MQNFLVLWALPPDPRASGGWGLCPQAPRLQRLGASPPDPHWPPASGGSALRLPKQPPIANFRLRACACPYFEKINSKKNDGIQTRYLMVKFQHYLRKLFIQAFKIFVQITIGISRFK